METLALVRARLEARASSGELDAAFRKEWLSGFTYLEGCTLARPRSVLMLAVPSPAYSLSFDMEGRVRKLILPPTYVRYRATFAAVCGSLNEAVDSAEGPHFEVLSAPLKSLGAALGLVRYGKNNIAYAPPFGSYVQLVGLVSDLDLGDGGAAADWEWPMLAECRACDRCIPACTRGAISPGRFLLYAERCVVITTETPGELEPGMVHPSPACAIGCLRCQLVCPANAGRFRVEDSGVAFTSDETAFFLRHGALPEHPLADAIRAKFEPLGMTEPPEVFVRNVKFLLSRSFGPS